MNNKRNSIVGILILILGIIIGYYLGNEEEKEPYCVWAEKDGFIYVVQNPNSYVYNFYPYLKNYILCYKTFKHWFRIHMARSYSYGVTS